MRGWVLVLLSACGFKLSPGVAIDAQGDARFDAARDSAIDAPGDAPIDAPIDGQIDAPIDAPPVFNPATDCPGTYAIALAGQTSRYRIILTGQPFGIHSTDCANDLTGATHLAAVDNATELSAMMTRINATAGLPGGQGCAYVGGVQLRNQATQTAGWLAITGSSLLAMWDPGEPNDGSAPENNEENFTMLERTRTSLIDVAGTASFGALCECDGKPIATAAAAAISASGQ